LRYKRLLFAERVVYPLDHRQPLLRVIRPVRWMIGPDARLTAACFRATFAPGLVDDVRLAVVSALLRLDMRRRFGSRTLAAPPASALLARPAEPLDIVDAALADCG
jgi:hypothetical protein